MDEQRKAELRLDCLKLASIAQIQAEPAANVVCRAKAFSDFIFGAVTDDPQPLTST